MGLFDWLKRKKVKKEAVSESAQKVYGELSLEEYKALLIKFYKQDCALDNNMSYFVPQDSFFGEMLDNGIRIKILKDGYKEFEGQYDDEELHKVAESEFKKDSKSGMFYAKPMED